MYIRLLLVTDYAATNSPTLKSSRPVVVAAVAGGSGGQEHRWRGMLAEEIWHLSAVTEGDTGVRRF